MVWYSHSCIAYSTAFPVAFVALLVPYLSTRYESSLGYGLLPYDILGGALVNALLAAVGTHFGFGVSFFYAIWAVAGALASPFVIEVCVHGCKVLHDHWWMTRAAAHCTSAAPASCRLADENCSSTGICNGC